MALRTVVPAILCCAVIPGAAEASSKPKFPKTVSGTISGSRAGERDGQTNKSSWTIKGVRFRLEHIRFVENTWTGFYKVTAGTVTFSASESGPCSYSVDKTFPLKRYVTTKVSTPFYLNRDMLGRDSYGGNMWPSLEWNATRTCTFADGGEPTTETFPVGPGNLFDARSPRSFRIGKSMKGRYKYDDGDYGTTVWTWSLKSRR